MVPYSSNLGNKLQMMVGIGKGYGFTLNLTCRGRLPTANRSYRAKWCTANQIAEWSDVSQSRGRLEQRTHSGDEIAIFPKKASFWRFRGRVFAQDPFRLRFYIEQDQQ